MTVDDLYTRVTELQVERDFCHARSEALAAKAVELTEQIDLALSYISKLSSHRMTDLISLIHSDQESLVKGIETLREEVNALRPQMESMKKQVAAKEERIKALEDRQFVLNLAANIARERIHREMGTP